MQNNPTILLVVAALLVRNDGRFLVQKRPEGRSMAGLWEFPGGKLEPQESAKNALVRELWEELGVNVTDTDLVPLIFADERLGEKNLLLMLYRCDQWRGEVQSREGAELRWVTLDELSDMPMPPADAPMLPLLAALL